MTSARAPRRSRLWTVFSIGLGLAACDGSIVSNESTRQNDGSSIAEIKLRVAAGRFAELLTKIEAIGRTTAKSVSGDVGRIEGGAASQEIDRWDPDLGSPAHALVLASSENHKPGMLRVVEELHMTVPTLQGSKVRADMTFFETPSGGAVFSTGSISFAGALAHNGYDNDICQIATNILMRFADETPFDYEAAVNGTD